jgi:uncharacterized protein (TIGR03492 family)
VARVLFVSNGHGEAAIADRIAQELSRDDQRVLCDHLALVGDGSARFMCEVGPRAPMPSGGLIAMGNVANIVRDLRGGLLALTFAQRRFLAGVRSSYAHAVAVGDVYALLMTLTARTPTTYVGTAKSVRVAPYGAYERRVLRRARSVFVRDEPTAQRLRSQGVAALAAGNPIVDLFATDDDPRAEAAVSGFHPAVAIFPGSRVDAYDDGCFLLDLLRRNCDERPALGAVVSIAPTLDAEQFARVFDAAGWSVETCREPRIPFVARLAGRLLLRAWDGEIGPLLRRVSLVLGQAGTANEAAAAAGVPVAAIERKHDRKSAWYRMRQRGLLGDALALLPGDSAIAAAGVATLLDDGALRDRMSRAGRERMGAAGGSRAIAAAVLEHLA